jgi:copper chaperone CopZ
MGLDNEKTKGNRIEFSISEMQCGVCEFTVKDEIKKVDGVRSVRLNRRKNRVLVTLSPGKEVSIDTLMAKVNAIGYRTEKLTSP